MERTNYIHTMWVDIDLACPTTDEETVQEAISDKIADACGEIDFYSAIVDEDDELPVLSMKAKVKLPGKNHYSAPSWGYYGGDPGYSEYYDSINIEKMLPEILSSYSGLDEPEVSVNITYQTYEAVDEACFDR